MQACNSLLLFANVFNAVDAFGTGDATIVGNTLLSLYPPFDNGTTVSLIVGHTNVTWDTSQVYNETFLAGFTDQQLGVLVFDVFGRIFESFSLHLPNGYEELLHELGDGVVANDNTTYTQLLVMLLTRFVVSAVYYLVACVISLVPLV